MISKKEAIETIVAAAQIYKDKWNGRNLLLIYGVPLQPQYLTITSNSSNFAHLTGVVINEHNILQNIPPNLQTELQNELANQQNATNETKSKIMLYLKAKEGILSANDFQFRTDGSTEQKLDVLKQAMYLPTSRKTIMIGTYNRMRSYFDADLIIGKEHVCMGLKRKSGQYIPCSVLKDSINRNVNGRQNVLAVLSKGINEKEYSVEESVSRTIERERLMIKFHKLYPHINIDSSLYNGGATLSSAQGGKVENIVQDVAGFSSSGAATLDTFTFQFPSPRHILEMIAEKVLELFDRLTSKKEHSPATSNELHSPKSEEEPITPDHSDEPIKADSQENEIMEKQESKKMLSTSPPTKTEPYFILLENDKQLDCLKQSGISFEIRTLNDRNSKYIVSVEQKDKEAALACVKLSQHTNRIKR